jgi:hypothetical protein
LFIEASPELEIRSQNPRNPKEIRSQKSESEGCCETSRTIPEGVENSIRISDFGLLSDFGFSNFGLRAESAGEIFAIPPAGNCADGQFLQANWLASRPRSPPGSTRIRPECSGGQIRRVLRPENELAR